MRRSLLIACVLLVVPATAHAEDDDDEQMVFVEPPAADPPPESPPIMVVTPATPAGAPKKWVDVSYASQTLLLDGAAVSLFAFGLASDSQPLPGFGLLTYAFAPPIVHFTHGNVGKGFADMGIRMVSPFLFAVPGLMLAIAATPDDYQERKTAMDIGGYAGMALGAAFAMAVDALVLAKERVPEERAYMTDDARIRTRRGGVAHAEARRVHSGGHDARSEKPRARAEAADEGPAHPEGTAR